MQHQFLKFRSDQKYRFLAPIGLKFWDQAFLDLEIQKIHSVWPDFFSIIPASDPNQRAFIDSLTIDYWSLNFWLFDSWFSDFWKLKLEIEKMKID